MVSRLLKNIGETLIAFQLNEAENAFLSNDFITSASTLLIPFT